MNPVKALDTLRQYEHEHTIERIQELKRIRAFEREMLLKIPDFRLMPEQPEEAEQLRRLTESYEERRKRIIRKTRALRRRKHRAQAVAVGNHFWRLWFAVTVAALIALAHVLTSSGRLPSWVMPALVLGQMVTMFTLHLEVFHLEKRDLPPRLGGDDVRGLACLATAEAREVLEQEEAEMEAWGFWPEAWGFWPDEE